jgi:hypothetical protein
MVGMTPRPQRARELVLGPARDGVDLAHLVHHAARLLDHRLAARGEQHLVLVALEEPQAQLVLQLREGEGKRGLGDEALLRGAAEMALLGERHDVLELGEGHGYSIDRTNGKYNHN